MVWLGYPPIQSYKGLDLTELPLNHAWVIANTSLKNVGVYSVRHDCFNCPYKLEKHLTPNQLESWMVDVSHQTSWRIKTIDRPDEYLKLNSKGGWICQMSPTFEEYGVYHLDIGLCYAKPEVEPYSTYYPLLLFSLILLGICSIYTSINYCRTQKRQQKEVKEAPEKAEQTKDVKQKPSFVFDVYRGIVLAVIIFFTTGGGGYPIFNNDWGGLTIAECLFFGYIWSIGARIPTFMDKAVKTQTKCVIIGDVFITTCFLVLLGTAIDSTVADQHSTLRLWCPLQKIGIAYFIVATVYLLTVQKFEMESKILICKALTNIVSLLWSWLFAVFLLAILSIMISTLASFNCLANIRLLDTNADEMSLVEEDVSQNCNNRMTEYVNKIFTDESLKMINVNNYFGFSRGVMGLMSAAIHMLIGLKAGWVYLSHPTHKDRLKLWIFWASLDTILGVCFAVLSYPLNFNLWPIASILFVSAASIFIFCLVYLATDVLEFTSDLLSSLGVTSLAILCGHILFSNTLPFTWGIEFHNHLLYLTQNLWIVFLWLIAAVILKKRNVKFEI